MKNVIKFIFSAFLVAGLASTSLMADPAKGQKFYLKYMKDAAGMNGAQFAKEHTQAEWAELFDGNAEKFIDVYSKKYPALDEFFKGDKFEKALEHIKDFCIEYASDSGKVPSC